MTQGFCTRTLPAFHSEENVEYDNVCQSRSLTIKGHLDAAASASMLASRRIFWPRVAKSETEP